MSLTIYGFTGSLLGINREIVQVPSGAPISKTVSQGSYVVPAGVYLLKIDGIGTITWVDTGIDETFTVAEYRGVAPGMQLMVA